MASTDARPVPLKATAYRFYFVLLGANGAAIQSPTFTSSKVSKDGGALANTANSIVTVSGGYVHYIDFTSTEMSADALVFLATHDQSGAPSVWVTINPKAAGGIPVTLEANQDVRNVTGAVASVTSLAAGSVTAASAAADTMAGFVPDNQFSRDNVGNVDEHTVQFLNIATGAPLQVGSTTGNVTITIKLRDAGTTIVNGATMTHDGNGVWKYNATSRIPSGDTGIVTFGVTHSTYGALSMKRCFVSRDTA